MAVANPLQAFAGGVVRCSNVVGKHRYQAQHAVVRVAASARPDGNRSRKTAVVELARQGRNKVLANSDVGMRWGMDHKKQGRCNSAAHQKQKVREKALGEGRVDRSWLQPLAGHQKST